MTTVQYSTSSTASTILCSALILLFFTQIQAQNDKQASCSSSCGEIRNISYPFRLKGDPSGCGDPDYELSCVDNKTILELFPGKYYVKSISYDDQIVRLVDANFANGSCSLPSGSIENADGYIRDSRFRGVVSSLQSRFRFLKCSKNISRDDYTSVPCMTTNGTYFYTTYDGDYLMHSNESSCSLVSVAPAYPPKGVTKFASNEAVMEQLEAGFDVGWSIVCRDCSLSGKSCVVKSWDKPLTYICEKEYKSLTTTEAKLIIMAIVVGGLIGLALIIVILVFVIRRCRRRQNAANGRVKNLHNQQPSTAPIISNS